MDVIENIIKRYLSGEASKEEQLILLEFLRKGEENLLLFQRVKEVWETNPDRAFKHKEWEAWYNVLDCISNPIKKLSISRLWLNAYRVASVVALLLLVGLVLVFNRLHNQKVIVNTVSGQNLNLVLPDSSEVILNSNSTIEYRPLAFTFNRMVELKGEAFFDVKKSVFNNFIVKSGELRVKVLGTRFNVNAYPEDENYEVVLEVGSVDVSLTSLGGEGFTLYPDEKVLIERSTAHVKINAVNTRLYTSWTQGLLCFYDTPFNEVVTRLQRRYGVRIRLSDPIIHDFLFSTTLCNEPFGQVLDLIQAALPIRVLEEEGVVFFVLDKKRYDEYERVKME